jgi:hypothetical protein
MWPYWLMLLLPAWGVFSRRRLPASQARAMWFLVGCLLALMMGLRHEVGGDWTTYVGHFNWIEQQSFGTSLTGRGDPGYYGLGWLLAWAGGDVHALNLVCAAVLAWGTVAFARRQPAPWLALFAAVPYLLIVVGMGYTRQSAAIGCSMLALIALSDGRRRKFVFWILLAAAFHKTAVVLLPIAALSATRNRTWTYVWIGVVAVFGVWLFLYDTSETLYLNYVESDYRFASQGAGIRVAMDAVPAVLYLVFQRRFARSEEERRLWMWLALIALLCVPLLSVSPTAVDRMALYLIPIQLFVFGRLPTLARTIKGRTEVVLGVVAYYAAVQFVWLNFAQTAFAWVPYRLFPLAS